MLGDGEHKQKAFSASEVIVSDGRVVLLAGCVENVYLDLFSIEDHLLSVTVSFGGLIVFYKLGEAIRSKDYSRTLILHLILHSRSASYSLRAWSYYILKETPKDAIHPSF